MCSCFHRILDYFKGNSAQQIDTERMTALQEEDTASCENPGLDQSTELELAIVNQDHKSLVDTINSSVDVNVTFCTMRNEDCTPLILAIKRSDVRCLELLIEAGADVNRKENNGKTPVMVAAEMGFPNKVQLLIQHGAYVNFIAKDGLCKDTALTIAARNGDKECLKILLEAGADVNFIAKDESGEDESAVILATKAGDKDCLKSLIAAGADVNFSPNSGETALIIAAEKGDIDCLQLLIDAGADVNLARNNALGEQTAVVLATKTGNKACLSSLIEAGADVNYIGVNELKDVTTALFIAATKGDKEILGMLIQAGADVNFTSQSGVTAVKITAEKGYKECLKLLIGSGAAVNLDTMYGTIIQCAEYGRYECVEMLMTGASAKRSYDEEREPDTNRHPAYIRVAASLILNWFLTNIRESINYVTMEHAKCTEVLLDAGADVNTVIPKHKSVLHLAVYEDFVNLFTKAIQAGADVNIADSTGTSVLMRAAEIGHVTFIRDLIYAGADVNPTKTLICKNSVLVSTMESLARKEDLMLELSVRSLVRAGANVNTVTEEGTYTLEFASDLYKAKKGSRISKELYNCVRMLILAGANLKLKTFGECLDDCFDECLQLRNQLQLNLQHLCRKVIRKQIIAANPDSNLIFLVKSWQLPTRLEEQLLLEDIVDLYPEELENNQSLLTLKTKQPVFPRKPHLTRGNCFDRGLSPGPLSLYHTHYP